MSAKLDDIKLIELVKQNSHLYDKNHEEYNERAKKNITWKAIGVALGTTGEACQKRYRNLRDRFTKEKKVRGEAMLTDKSLPVVFKRMMFIWDHLLHRRYFKAFPPPPPPPPGVVLETPELNEEVKKQCQYLECIEKLKDTDETTFENGSSDEQEEVIGDTTESDQIQSCSNFEMNVSESEDELLQDMMINTVQDESNTHKGECSTEKIQKETVDVENVPQLTIKWYPKAISEQQNLSNQNTIDVTDIDSTCEPPEKRMKIDMNSSSSKITETLMQLERANFKICNAAFCAVIKQYLDKMKSPERVSIARLQILRLLHSELYPPRR